MTVHLDEVVAVGGRPKRDGAVGVAQMDDGVGRVLSHDGARAHPRPVSRYRLARRGVVIFEISRPSHGGKQPVVGEELQPKDVGVVRHAMDFGTGIVVHKHVLLLRQRKHGGIVQEGAIANNLVDVKLGPEGQRVAVHEGDVPPALTAEEPVPAGPIVRHAVRGVRAEAEVEDLAGRLLVEMIALQFLLRELVRLLHLVLGFDQTRLLRVEDGLGIGRGQGRLHPFGLVNFHLGLHDSVRPPPADPADPAMAALFQRLARDGGQFVRLHPVVVLAQRLETAPGRIGSARSAVHVGLHPLPFLRRHLVEPVALELGPLLSGLNVRVAPGHLVGAPEGIVGRGIVG
mmetsp:Transcript_12064/g.34494  ORF Transcript_12064/g.34494 Transcript_12064/m.34494 type:complete len:344 (-) Transcript_12064:133-1164(-)